MELEPLLKALAVWAKALRHAKTHWRRWFGKIRSLRSGVDEGIKRSEFKIQIPGQVSKKISELVKFLEVLSKHLRPVANTSKSCRSCRLSVSRQRDLFHTIRLPLRLSLRLSFGVTLH